MKDEYLISVDGGGTKTEFCILNIAKNVKKSMTFGSSNYKTVGLEAAKQNIKQSFSKLCKEMQISPTQIRGMIIGISGYDTPQDHKVYMEIIEEIDLEKEKIYLCNDSEMLFLSIAQAPGIAVVGGTGSIAIGFDGEHKKARCGGWGSPLSDMGSGYWIGEQALKEWIRFCDKQAGYQPVFETLIQWYGLQNEAYIPYMLSRLQTREIASCAKVIAEGADGQDAFCLQIMKEAGLHLAEIAYGVYLQLDLHRYTAIDLVVSGSIFKNTYYLNVFREETRLLMKETKINYITFDESPADLGLKLAEYKFCSSNKE